MNNYRFLIATRYEEIVTIQDECLKGAVIKIKDLAQNLPKEHLKELRVVSIA